MSIVLLDPVLYSARDPEINQSLLSLRINSLNVLRWIENAQVFSAQNLYLVIYLL